LLRDRLEFGGITGITAGARECDASLLITRGYVRRGFAQLHLIAHLLDFRVLFFDMGNESADILL